MYDREKVIKGLEHCRKYGSLCGMDCSGIFVYSNEGQNIVKMNEHRNDCPYGKSKTGCIVTLIDNAIALLKDQENEYENGFNDAMLSKQELMYEGTDGKWYKKDW